MSKKAERSEPKKDINSSGGDGGSVVLVPRIKEAESSVSNFFGDQTRWSSMQRAVLCKPSFSIVAAPQGNVTNFKYTTASNVTIKSNEAAINGKPLSYCLLSV